jgi:hypothetical protein
MIRHSAFAALGSGLYFAVSLLAIKFFDAGVQVEGFLKAVTEGSLLRSILVDISVFGAVAGGMASMVFRKSVNHRLYTWITLVMVLLFCEFVIVSIL